MIIFVLDIFILKKVTFNNFAVDDLFNFTCTGTIGIANFIVICQVLEEAL